MSKSPKTVTSTSGPPAWARPYFESLAGRANEVSQQPFQQYQGQFTAPFNQDQNAAFEQIRNQVGQGNPLLDQANSYLSDTLSGQNANPYAGQNTYLQDMIDSASRDVTQNYQEAIVPGLASQFAQGGAFGGSAYQEQMGRSQRELADQLGDVTSGLRFQDYTAQQQLGESALARQMQALGMVPQMSDARFTDAQALLGIGGLQQNQQNQENAAQYAEFLRGQGWDAQQLGLLGNALGTVGGAYNSNTSPNPNYQSTGQQAAGWAQIIASLYGGGG
jgi:hypothetical protein